MKLKGFPPAAVLGAVALMGLLGTTGTAQAQLAGNIGDFSANAGVVSDYRFRGISQNFRYPALQGGLDFAAKSGWYLGTWGSMVNKDQYTDSYGNGGAGLEWDLYGGYKMDLGGGWVLDAGLLQYVYPGAGRNNTLEAYVSGTWDWFQVKYSHSLNDKFFGVEDARGSGYIDLTATYPVAPDLNVVGHFGYQRVGGHSDLNYSDYKLGVTYNWQGALWGAAIVGASEDAPFTYVGGKTKDLGGTGIVLSVSKTF